ncbi:MAG: hypothetical protein M3N93_03250 [Acidobacteriota bacterium]|nr:hypothetical protein [Acidobacteriota bacterium]
MKGPTKKQRVLELAAARGWVVIGEAEWRELRSALTDVSEATIRRSGLAIRVPWSGVAVHSIEELETSLRAFTDVYESRPDLRRYCRDEIIAAKDRARWASLSPRVEENKRALKAEMAQWMLVWLDDPSVFPIWAQLRKNALSGKNSIH